MASPTVERLSKDDTTYLLYYFILKLLEISVIQLYIGN